MISKRTITVILSLVMYPVAMITSCGDLARGDRKVPAAEQISSQEWQSLSRKRILFGHQSVGSNILSGVNSLAVQAGVSLKVTESRSPAADFGITHFKIGSNEDPYSKIKDFEDTVKSGAAQGADIALMKLCYIDINGATDVKKLAEVYCSSLDRLSLQFPKTIFVAVTTPLTTLQGGPKGFIKRLLGREPSGYAENFRRQEFNTIVRNRFSPQFRLFDLAKVEAEGAGNHEYRGQPLEVLNASITDDGGHLNTQGQHYVAAKLLKGIAAITQKGIQ